MKRLPIVSRPDWEKKILEQGFLFYKDDSYYKESAVYTFSLEEVNIIENATAEIYRMCLAVVEHVVANSLWDEFCIPKEFGPLIEWSWRTQQPTVYGRFDLAYHNGVVKLLEFNADTPTLLLETSVIQWFWLNDFNPELDQFNHLHEALIAHLQNIKPDLLPGTLHFTCNNNAEDFVTTRYLEDIAAQAGLTTKFTYIDDITVDESRNFVDSEGNRITNIFKLYPYEWLFDEPFGELLIKNRDRCIWIEPAYKAILSNKMMLKYIAELFPESPYILRCTTSEMLAKENFLSGYAKKPIFSREGENVSLVTGEGLVEETGGEYGDEGYIFQEYVELPEFDGMHPIIGSWVVGGQPAGMGIRESAGRITNVTSSFCSHYIEP